MLRVAWAADLTTAPQIMFPLLESIESAHNRARADPAVAAPKQEAYIFVHHSRDTLDKQWSETRALALGGVSQLFKSFGHILAGLPGFTVMWARTLKIFHSAIVARDATEPTKEIVLVAVRGMWEIMCNLHTVSRLSTELWTVYWEEWNAIANSILGRDRWESAVLLLLLGGMKSAITDYADWCRPDDKHGFINVCETLLGNQRPGLFHASRLGDVEGAVLDFLLHLVGTSFSI